ncbi:MAG TPA: mechanosensitive ion channel domain-containing protein [Pseudoxanthomonas sp.]|nr:mechanosensitive ion channel domain-containing protein [Pseudoxanthomonas sp.]
MNSAHWNEVIATAWPLLVAVVLGLAVRQVLMAISRRAGRQAATHTRARVVQVIAVPAALALPLLFLSMAVRTVALEEVWIARIQHALGIGGLACLTWLALRAVAAVEGRILREHPIEVADNLAARRIQTQTRVIAGVVKGAVMLIGAAVILMTFPAIRQIGATLLASAGLIGLVAGIAARPVFGNLIAGLQIALTQPIRLDDVVIVEGEWGRVETITSAFVVVRVWDERRLIVPLQWFIENPFQNWTHTSAELLGATFLWLDYRTPMDAVRAELERICESDDRWDGRVCVAQVTETDQTAQQVRLLVSARNSGDLFDLRCAVRERMIDFLNARHPQSLPRLRMDLARSAPDAAQDAQTSASSPARIGEQMSSPGAESVTQADIAARRAQAQAPH